VVPSVANTVSSPLISTPVSDARALGVADNNNRAAAATVARKRYAGLLGVAAVSERFRI
jgi:hypothetical protein